MKRLGTASRRVSTTLLALLVAIMGLIGSPGHVAAVHSVPWRFTTVTPPENSIGGLSYKDFFVTCPAGYIPVSGGVVGGSLAAALQIMEEWPDSTDGTFHLLLYNTSFSASTVDLAVNCVWLDDVGTIYYRIGTFSRNSSGYAGGNTYCGNGLLVLSAGVAWSVGGYRHIYFSSPITQDTQYGTGWYAAGYISTSGATLGVELRCVAASLLTSEYTEAADSGVGPANSGATAICAAGYRILTGGSAPPADQQNPGTNQGFSTSGPFSTRNYTAFGREESGVTMRSMALCVPSSTVSPVTFTQTPEALSTVNNGTITFLVTDSAGEQLTLSCYLDGNPRGCAPGNPVGFGPLVDGDHIFEAVARNQYGSQSFATFLWTIDTTAPLISSHAPTSAASLTGPFTITFSEPVTGVTSSALTVHAESANVNIAGTLTHPTSATAKWTPSASLVPGETYRFSLTSAIHDMAGNPLTPTYFTVRTSTSIENTSAVLIESWDRDASTLASGGSFISSNLSGSRADLTFTATAGQTLSLYGIRVPSGGYADIYLDGIKKITASFYAATTARARVYLSGALTAGTHIISVRPLGTKPAASTNYWVDVDNAAIGATLKQESSFRQLFRRTTSASASGGSYDVMVHKVDSDTTPDRFQVTVVGTGVKIYATRTATSGSAKVYVDGVLKATINVYAASTTYQALVYSGTFTLGQHVVRIDAVGTTTGSNSDVDLDRITVN